MKPKRIDYTDALVINPLQLGGIETSVLDNGAGRGVRIAWVNTGGGLRYKVAIDRGLDIADAEFMGLSLTYHTFGGMSFPQHAYNRGMEWLKNFPGGLVVGCGPLSVGDPFIENGNEYGLHGTHSNTPAAIESIVNPDLPRKQYEMSITGIVKTARLFDPNVELRRTISSTLGVPAIRITDSFTNRGNTPAEHQWLLHINFGYPLLAPGESTYCYRGKINPIVGSTEWFVPGNDYRAAPQPLEVHRGAGEYFSYIDPEADRDGNVLAGVVNTKRGIGVGIEFSKKDFHSMGNWQHWALGEYVGAVEPMNCGVEGRGKDRDRGALAMIEPGQTVEHRCTITATDNEADLDALLALNR